MKTKLNLEELKATSFVTVLNNGENKTIDGQGVIASFKFVKNTFVRITKAYDAIIDDQYVLEMSQINSCFPSCQPIK